MNYELAEELKDAGFPFLKLYGEIGLEITMPSLGPIATAMGHDFVRFGEEWFLIPTLSELIEACGEPKRSPFLQLRKARAGWCAALHGDDDVIIEMVLNVDTPEEAVARLWLALNKK